MPARTPFPQKKSADIRTNSIRVIDPHTGEAYVTAETALLFHPVTPFRSGVRA
ncbi:hypothetical protein [Fimbriiglobus ruber]|uniref:Uncharacterized protein n=1 Tax=Fimbriiglobus ruber TaxID=1908690 RepID=A0A225E755_9BACT|nr:hypothetical protein [Fimbriiglobus ruber]OWK44495.1 hypothetical protein FRUB_02427 [Fimbriiglobus ruber]